MLSRTAPGFGPGASAASGDIDAMSPRQMFYACVAMVLPTAAFFLPGITAQEAGPDAWLAALLGVVLCLPTLAAVAALARRFGTCSLVDLAEAIAGRLPGRVLCLAVAIGFLQILYVGTREFTELLASVVIPETPPEVAVIFIMAASGYLAKKGGPTVGRMAETVVPLTFALAALMIALAAKDMDASETLPFLARGMLPVVRGSLINAVWPGEAILASVILGQLVTPATERARATAKAVVASGVMNSLTTYMSLTLVGTAATPSLVFALFRMARLVSLAGVIERVESLVVALWVLAMFVKLGLVTFILSLLLARVLGLAHYGPLVLPLVIAAGGLSLTQFDNIAELLDHVATSATGYGLVLTLGVPIALLGAAVVTGKRSTGG